MAEAGEITLLLRAWSQIFYAWDRNNGYRTDENVRLLQSAVKECRDNHLSSRETADASIDANHSKGQIICGQIDSRLHVIDGDLAAVRSGRDECPQSG